MRASAEQGEGGEREGEREREREREKQREIQKHAVTLICEI